MAKSKSSNRWMNEHLSDQYVKKSREDGYRSRASYKLVELNKKDRLLRSGNVVVDLGASPGGWSQVAKEFVGPGGVVVASDLLAFEPLEGVSFIQGDFNSQEVFDQLTQLLNGRGVDLVMSDMAPNMTGIRDIDQPASMNLVELALDAALHMLSPGGAFVAKVFQGEGFDSYVAEVKSSFNQVFIRKPSASRSRSKEIYLVAKGFSGL